MSELSEELFELGDAETMSGWDPAIYSANALVEDAMWVQDAIIPDLSEMTSEERVGLAVDVLAFMEPVASAVNIEIATEDALAHIINGNPDSMGPQVVDLWLHAPEVGVFVDLIGEELKDPGKKVAVLYAIELKLEEQDVLIPMPSDEKLQSPAIALTKISQLLRQKLHDERGEMIVNNPEERLECLEFVYSQLNDYLGRIVGFRYDYDSDGPDEDYNPYHYETIEKKTQITLDGISELKARLDRVERPKDKVDLDLSADEVTTMAVDYYVAAMPMGDTFDRHSLILKQVDMPAGRLLGANSCTHILPYGITLPEDRIGHCETVKFSGYSLDESMKLSSLRNVSVPSPDTD